MKISLNWIKNYVSHGLSTEKLSHKLTMAGLETEEISKVGKDTIMEFEITPNRADCLSMIGIAREIATVTQKKLKIPAIKRISYPRVKFPIQIESTNDCKKYVGTVIKGIKVKAAPSWMKEKITSLGCRPISNMVDITNFVLFEQGQPLHAFDLDKLEGRKIIVRRAKKGEKIITIDGEEHKLDPSILVIADARRPVAIAGIMGGKDTEVGPTTKNILLESAYFDPILIRRASRKLGLSSDSSYRFERGVDFEGVVQGSKRATQFILELAGGHIAAYGSAGAKKNPFKRPTVSLSVDDLNAYLGTKVLSKKVKSILTSLGFKVSGQGKKLKVTPPSFRSDIHRDVDLIEEVARIIGYDNLPTSLPTVPTTDIDLHARKNLRDGIREILLGQGFNEAVTFSLISQNDLDRSGLKEIKSLAVVNPLSLDQALMRPNMLPCLLSVAKNNINFGQKNVRIFELAKIYTPKAEEKEVLAIILSGKKNEDWRVADAFVDIFDLKGSLQYLFQRLHLKDLVLKNEKLSFFDQTQSTSAVFGTKPVGCLGKVRKEILKQWEIKDADVYFAQIELPDPKQIKKKKFKKISEFPAIVQDVSLAVPKDVSFDQIKEIASAHGEGLLKEIRFNELYMGEKIPAGQKGFVFSLIYQSNEKTLRGKVVLEIHERIVAQCIEQLKAIRR